MSELEPTKADIEEAIKLSDDFARAKVADELLQDVPLDALPEDYRGAIKLRMDRDWLYVAFNDNPENLESKEELRGYLPEATLMKISAMNMPRSTGRIIKSWIDGTRSSQTPPEK